MDTPPPSSDDLLDVIESIYASALEPDEAPHALRALNRSVQGNFAQVLTLERSSGAVLHSWISEADPASKEVHRQYVERWAALDPRARWLASLPAGAVVRCHDNFDDAFVGASSFYQKHLIAHGLRWALAGVLESREQTSTVVINVRSVDAPPFEDWAAAALRQLMPHLRKAYLIRARLEHQAGAGSSAMEMLRALPLPCLFTDHAGRCIERNRAFDDVSDALALRISVGRVRFCDGELQSTWETALSDTHATAVEHGFVATGPDGKPWRVHLIPLHPRLAAGAHDSKMILVVFEPRAHDVQPAAGPLAPRARLTPAELEVATSVLQGLPAKVIAKQRGASVNTVRSQIMAILDKTGFKSQRELIAAAGASTLGAGTLGTGSARPGQSKP